MIKIRKRSLVHQIEFVILGKEALYEYYRIPSICLLRMKDSINLWEKRLGANGYFDFIE